MAFFSAADKQSAAFCKSVNGKRVSLGCSGFTSPEAGNDRNPLCPFINNYQGGVPATNYLFELNDEWGEASQCFSIERDIR
jgi:hypothetical protein